MNANKFDYWFPTHFYSYTNRVMMAIQKSVWVTIRKLCLVLVFWDCQTRWQCQHMTKTLKLIMFMHVEKLMHDISVNKQVLANGRSGISNKEKRSTQPGSFIESQPHPETIQLCWYNFHWWVCWLMLSWWHSILTIHFPLIMCRITWKKMNGFDSRTKATVKYSAYAIVN